MMGRREERVNRKMRTGIFPESVYFPAHESKKGVTLIELLVVLLIVAVLLGISVPTIAVFSSPKHRLRKDARELIVALGEARQAAMDRKTRIDVRIVPQSQEIRLVETVAYRSLMQKDPYGLMKIEDEDRQATMSNRFEKVVAFDDSISLEAFTVEDIETEKDEGENLFRKIENDFLSRDLDDGMEEVVAIEFNHFGGSNGGGISLVREQIRLDIACDILTGRPKLVARKGETP